MFKVKKSIYSIMLLAVGTAAAQTPATELTYPRPQTLVDFGSEVAVYDRFTIASAQFDNNNNGQNGGAGTYHGTIRLFENNNFLRTYTYGNGQIIGLGKKNTISIGFQCIAAGVPDYSIAGVKSGAVVIANKLNNGTYHTTLNYQLLPEPNDVVEGLQFGAAVSTDGDWVAVGAPGRNFDKGGVCMFQRTGYLQWVRRGWISVPGIQESDQFGSEVKLSGDQMIVKGGNKLCIYKLINGTWSNVALFTHANSPYYEVDITENHAVARSFNSDFRDIAVVFKKGANNTWSVSQTLTGPNAFARELAISGQYLIISDYKKVYYYQLQGTLFNMIGSVYIPQSNPSTGRLNKNIIGSSIDNHSDRIVVADVTADYVGYSSPGLGAVYTDRFWNGFSNPNNLRIGNSEMETSEGETSAGFSVYPNPSATNVSVTSSEEIVKATATRSTGEVLNLDFAGKTLLTNQLSEGIYQIHVETTTGSFTTKFVKIK